MAAQREIKDSDILRKNKLRFDLILLAFRQSGAFRCPGLPGVVPRVDSLNCMKRFMQEAWFLLPKENKEDCRVIEDVILVKVKPGRKIIIPPGYGHILINPGEDDLVIASFSSKALAAREPGPGESTWIIRYPKAGRI